jgi:hypothetical protein
LFRQAGTEQIGFQAEIDGRQAVETGSSYRVRHRVASYPGTGRDSGRRCREVSACAVNGSTRFDR